MFSETVDFNPGLSVCTLSCTISYSGWKCQASGVQACGISNIANKLKTALLRGKPQMRNIKGSSNSFTKIKV